MDVMEKLVELLTKYFGVDPAYYGIEAAHLADHLIDHGVTILPCKIGDEFWTEWVGIRKVKCSMITQKADGSWKFRFTVENSGGAGVNLSLDELGKRLFATKEEAESAFCKPLKED